MNDLRIIPEGSGPVDFAVYGASPHMDIHMLLQRIYILLLTGIGNRLERGGDTFVGLMEYLYGGNMPNDSDMTGTLSLACADILSRMDTEDRAAVSSLTCACVDGRATITLTLVDGTTVIGNIK